MTTEFYIEENVWLFDTRDGDFKEGRIEEITIKRLYSFLSNKRSVGFYYTIRIFGADEIEVESNFVGRTYEQCRKRVLHKLGVS